LFRPSRVDLTAKTTTTFPLERGERHRVRLVRNSSGSEASLQLDDFAPMELPGKRELRRGEDVLLPDGTSLFVRLANPILSGWRWDLRRGEVPIPGSYRDPWRILHESTGILLIMAGMTLILGLGVELSGSGLAAGRFEGVGILLSGAILVGLAIWTRRRASLVGAWLAVGFVSLDLVFALGGDNPPGSDPGFLAALVRLGMLAVLLRGVGAAHRIRSQRMPQSRKG